ncbi:hypothetical protein QSV34_00555 [Porticoccus sp. W117]|nr:protein YgfX [Porticoccus sp. W117]MDM3869833.1 hypothetical protein [Porticoccus sp. W117]
MLLASWLAPVPLWLPISLTIIVPLSFCISLKSYRKTPQMLASGDSWLLQKQDGTQCELMLCAPCYISRWLTVIPVRAEGQKRRLVIPFDSLSADQYRRLGVVLRLSC